MRGRNGVVARLFPRLVFFQPQMDKKTYQWYLDDPRWIQRRNQILSRDRNTCQMCGTQYRRLHVHHKGYLDGHLPWEYPSNMLITLCEDCHHYVHNNVPNKTFSNNSCGESVSLSIGDVYWHDHSDYENTGIIYEVDYVNNRIFLLEFDNGAAYDNIYDEITTFSNFEFRYLKYENELAEHFCFCQWLCYVSKHLEQTPILFRNRWEEILANNKALADIVENRGLYLMD